MITSIIIVLSLTIGLLLWAIFSATDRFESIKNAIENLHIENEVLQNKAAGLRFKLNELASSLKVEWVDNTERTVGYKKVGTKKTTSTK